MGDERACAASIAVWVISQREAAEGAKVSIFVDFYFRFTFAPECGMGLVRSLPKPVHNSHFM